MLIMDLDFRLEVLLIIVQVFVQALENDLGNYLEIE